MPLRVDCNCNVFITCCDGTEKQILTADQVRAIVQGQPGSPQPQPQPGASQCYHALLNANSKYLIPTPVNTGDTIIINNATGAVDNSHDGSWHCPDGSVFFAGACVGFPETNPANPVPSAPTSSPVIQIGSNFYSILPGVSFTVPASVSNIQPTIQVNDNAISGLAGTFQFDVCVTNNQVGSFTHVFDFTTSNGSWTPYQGPTCSPSSEATWISGAGWEQVLVICPDGGHFESLGVVRSLSSARVLTSISLEFVIVAGAFQNPPVNDQIVSILATVQTTLKSAPASSLPASPWVWTGSQNADHIQVNLVAGNAFNADPGGTVRLTKITVTGQGSDPF